MAESFSLFTRRQRRRWPAWVLIILVALLAAYLGQRVLSASTAAPTVEPATVSEPVPGAEPVASVPTAPPTLDERPPPPPEAARDPAPEIRDAVEQWRKAWSDKDAAAYLAAYADDFTPPDGLSPDDWRAQRKERLGTARRITLRLDRIEIEASGDIATARFLQHYRSGPLNEKVVKRLALRRTDGAWKITEEVVESPGRR